MKQLFELVILVSISIVGGLLVFSFTHPDMMMPIWR